MTPDLSYIARPLFYRRALLAALSAMMVTQGPLALATNVDRDKNEITIEAKPTPERALERFTVNVTAKAKAGKLPPFIGERQNIRNILEILNKSEGGSKVMYVLGDPGTGKTAMIEYAAGQIDNVELFALDLNVLEAGTGYRGMLEDRVQALIEAFVNHPNRVLMIDEMHVAAQMPGFLDKLKPAMARGEISIIGATTEREFTEFIEKDAALTSRASIFRLAKSSEAAVLSMLRAYQEGFEKKHGIKIAGSALEATARSVMRYYSNEPIKRKALDILDRAASRMILNNRFGNYDALAVEDMLEENKLHQKSVTSDLRLYPDAQEFRLKLRELREEALVLEDRLAEFKGSDNTILLEAELQKLKDALQVAKAKGDLATAARIQYKDIKELTDKIAVSGTAQLDGQSSTVLTDRQINKFVAREVGIPDSLIAASDSEKLELLDKTLNEKVIGQKEAINQVLRKTKIRMENVEPVKGPQGVFLFDGMPGVGKTELSKAIALSVYGDANRIVRIDMNTLGGGARAQLFGHGKGIVDSEQGGALDEVRRTPYTLVSFDEIDKAPADIWESLLQILDEGKVKDGRGRMLDFRNTMIVMQANFTGDYAVMKDIWTQAQIEQMFRMAPGSLDGLEGAARDAKVLDAAMASKGMPKAVRDRISVKLVLNPLSVEMAVTISWKVLQEQREHLWREKGVILSATPDVALALAKSGYSPLEGARPLLQNQSDVISNLLADLKLKKGQTVKLEFVESQDLKGGSFKATVDNAAVQARFVLYAETALPKAAKADKIAEAGKPAVATEPKDIAAKASRASRTKK